MHMETLGINWDNKGEASGTEDQCGWRSPNGTQGMEWRGAARRMEDHGEGRRMTKAEPDGWGSLVDSKDWWTLVELREHGAKEELKGWKAEVDSRARRPEVEERESLSRQSWSPEAPRQIPNRRVVLEEELRIWRETAEMGLRNWLSLRENYYPIAAGSGSLFAVGSGIAGLVVMVGMLISSSLLHMHSNVGSYSSKCRTLINTKTAKYTMRTDQWTEQNTGLKYTGKN